MNDSRPNIIKGYCVAWMHDDLNPYEDVSVGIDDNKNLLVYIEQTDYNEHIDWEGNSYRPVKTTIATIEFDEAHRLAQSMGTTIVHLPEKISNKFNPECNEFWSPIHIRKIFKKILNYLVNRGIKYTLQTIEYNNYIEESENDNF